MDGAPFQRTIPFNLDLVFRRGTGRRLLLCIAALVIPPVVLIGWISYRTAENHLEEDIQKSLRLNAELKSQQIDAYLQHRLNDAERQGCQPSTISFFKALLRRHADAQTRSSAFILSEPWKTAVSAYGSGIQLHADLHGYHEIRMLDPDGNVIFSNAENKGSVRNLNQPEMADSKIRTAFRTALETGKPVFSDFETGVPEDNGVRAFTTAAIGRAGDPPAGVIAFKILGSDIQRLLNMPEPEANTRVYLIDPDLTVLAGTIDGQRPGTRLTIKTAIAQQWRDAVSQDKSALPPSGLLNYEDPGGHRIIGTYVSIQPGHTPYALIVEIDRTMASAGIYRQKKIYITILILAGLGIVAVGAALARMLIEPVQALTDQMRLATHGKRDNLTMVFANHELGHLAMAGNDLIDQLRTLSAEHERQSRFLSGMARLHKLLGNIQNPEELCLRVLEFLSDFLDLSQADFYIHENGHLRCACHFPGQPACESKTLSSPGEGRVGKAALEAVMQPYRKDAAEGLAIPVPTVDLGNVVVIPLLSQETVVGGLELERTSVFSLSDGQFLQPAAETIAIALEATLTREKEKTLLEKTREQADQLKHREIDLEAKTHALETQRQVFRQSEQALQLKQLELEAANAQMTKNAADLEANMALLEQQKKNIQQQNAELEKAHRELADKARQLEISSQYKTEFMANMSHELRTPLNSILLLSRLLLEDKTATLTGKQVEFAQTIYSAGEDLLNLINDILDLAKVESGKIELELAPVAIQSIVQAMRRSFAPLAEQSGITFSIQVAEGGPNQFISDRKRIEQIVKNFLSNAFKFTPKGTIQLAFKTAPQPEASPRMAGQIDAPWLSISVSDTGIGIPKAKQAMVFDAFQQADGSTRRKYGGTGLGLSISRELAHMLGGEITLDSEETKGSCFTLHLPITTCLTEAPEMIRSGSSIAMAAAKPPSPADDDEADSQPADGMVPDDRHRLSTGNPCILIVDTDVATIETIIAVAHEHDFKVVVADQRMTGLHFADYYLPAAAFVDPHLTVSGNAWSVIAQIKANPKNHHIPVFTLSERDEKIEAVIQGAAGHILRPPAKSRLALVFRQIKNWQSQNDRNVLVVADTPKRVTAQIMERIGIQSIHFSQAATAMAAHEILGKQTIDAAILHPSLDAAEQQRFFKIWEAQPIPLLIYTKATDKDEYESAIKPFAPLAGLKPITSANQLCLALLGCLHLPPDAVETPCRSRLDALSGHRSPLAGRRVLLVDDDMRTVFAVTSVLEDQGVELTTGKTGKESLDKLDGFPDIDLILMDVMIADLDGYQAIKTIRDRKGHAHVPIIALTAKAMQGDREKCIDAGADDYLSKPVNLDKLISMLKIWLDPMLTEGRRKPE